MKQRFKWDKSWTQKQLDEQLKIPRVRKPIMFRPPKTGISINGRMAQRIAKKLGFQTAEVRAVLDAMLDEIEVTMENKQFVSIRGIGKMYLEIVPPVRRIQGHVIGKPEKVITPPHYKLRIEMFPEYKRKWKERKVTAEEIAFAYFTEEEMAEKKIAAAKRKAVSEAYWKKRNAKEKLDKKNNA